MTAQISDSLSFDKKSFCVTSVSSGRLFHPSLVGLDVEMMHTACYRGFYAHYTVEENSLTVESFFAGLNQQGKVLAERGEGPVVDGKLPKCHKRKCREWKSGTCGFVDAEVWSDWYYDGLRIPLNYSGGILVGANYVENLPIDLGFYRAIQYASVFELEFFSGKLTRATDWSDVMQSLRNRLESLKKEKHRTAAIAEIGAVMQLRLHRCYQN